MVFISLILVYFLGFGITLLLMLVFNRKALADYNVNNDTFWVKAEGYEPDIGDSSRQS